MMLRHAALWGLLVALVVANERPKAVPIVALLHVVSGQFRALGTEIKSIDTDPLDFPKTRNIKDWLQEMTEHDLPQLRLPSHCTHRSCRKLWQADEANRTSDKHRELFSASEHLNPKEHFSLIFRNSRVLQCRQAQQK